MHREAGVKLTWVGVLSWVEGSGGGVRMTTRSAGEHFLKVEKINQLRISEGNI